MYVRAGFFTCGVAVSAETAARVGCTGTAGAEGGLGKTLMK